MSSKTQGYDDWSQIARIGEMMATDEGLSRRAAILKVATSDSLRRIEMKMKSFEDACGGQRIFLEATRKLTFSGTEDSVGYLWEETSWTIRRSSGLRLRMTADWEAKTSAEVGDREPTEGERDLTAWWLMDALDAVAYPGISFAGSPVEEAALHFVWETGSILPMEQARSYVRARMSLAVGRMLNGIDRQAAEAICIALRAYGAGDGKYWVDEDELAQALLAEDGANFRGFVRRFGMLMPVCRTVAGAVALSSLPPEKWAKGLEEALVRDDNRTPSEAARIVRLLDGVVPARHTKQIRQYVGYTVRTLPDLPDAAIPSTDREWNAMTVLAMVAHDRADLVGLRPADLLKLAGRKYAVHLGNMLRIRRGLIPYQKNPFAFVYELSDDKCDAFELAGKFADQIVIPAVAHMAAKNGESFDDDDESLSEGVRSAAWRAARRILMQGMSLVELQRFGQTGKAMRPQFDRRYAEIEKKLSTTTSRAGVIELLAGFDWRDAEKFGKRPPHEFYFVPGRIAALDVDAMAKLAEEAGMPSIRGANIGAHLVGGWPDIMSSVR